MKQTDKSSTLDVILEELGQWGKHNIITYMLLILPVFSYGMMFNEFIFVAGDMDYRCEIPECETLNNTDWVSWAIPSDGRKLDKCHRYSPSNNKSFSSAELDSTFCTSDHFDKENIVECSNYIYYSDATIVKDFNLGCQDWKRTIVGSIHMVAFFCGELLTGILSDRFGRKMCLIMSAVNHFIFGVLKSFSINYAMYISLDFIQIMLSSGLMITAHMYLMEMVIPKHRLKVLTMVLCTNNLGTVMVAVIALVLPNWRKIIRIISVPMLISIMTLSFLSDSVRWLLVKGKKEEAIKLLTKMAHTNNLKLSETDLFSINADTDMGNEDEFDIEENKIVKRNDKKSAFKRVMHSRVILSRMLICIVLYISTSFAFFGLSLNSVSLSGNSKVNFILVSLVEIPTFIAVMFLLDRFGRRRTFVTFFTLTGIFCISQAYVPRDFHNVILMLYLAGKISTTFTLSTILIFLSEIFPTEVRQTLMSFVGTFALISNIAAPQVPLMSKYMESLPALIIAATSFISALLSLLLPETSYRRLPDTIEEAEGIKRTKT